MAAHRTLNGHPAPASRPGQAACCRRRVPAWHAALDYLRLGQLPG